MLQTGTTVVAPGIYDGLERAAGRAGRIRGRLRERRRHRARQRHSRPRAPVARGNRRPPGADRRRRLDPGDRRCRQRLRQRAQRAARGACLRARRRRRVPPRGPDVSQALRPLRRQVRSCRCSEMVGKLKAVRDALHDPDFVVIARTDAIAVEGLRCRDRPLPRLRRSGRRRRRSSTRRRARRRSRTSRAACRAGSSSTCSTAARRRCCRSRACAELGLLHRDHPERPAARRDQGDAAHARRHRARRQQRSR